MRRFGRAMAAIAGLTFGWVCYVYLTIPDVRQLRTQNPTTTAFIDLRALEAGAAGKTPRRVQQWVPYNRISADLKRAVLVAEDSAFWQHEGLDVEQLRESMETNLERLEFARGGSTITQQLAKNLYLSPSRNPLRKVRELLIARRLERELSKQRILELYLNLIEWGDGVWGAEAAARTYFGKPAAAITAEEAALLAAAIINPRILKPAQPSARLRRRQRLILSRMGRVTPPSAPTTVEAPAGEEPIPIPPQTEPVPPVLVPDPTSEAVPESPHIPPMPGEELPLKPPDSPSDI